ncbi:MAG: helix-turn-helix transcriptional regulator [Solobacterium sp.]|nr:helix-turn-helix transcriptional regulator [Solobacterium sp.]
MANSFAFPVIDMKKTGANIKYLREQNGMSVRQLQEVFGFSSPQSIYKWQWGDTLPDLPNLLLMANLWGVSVEQILVLEH